MSLEQSVVARFRALLGDRGVLQGADAEGYLEDFWGRAKGKALCVVLPASTSEVSAILATCHEHGIAVFPQGGNTSTCLGAVPDATGRSIVLSMRRMNRILAVDPVDNSLTVEAGCVLADVQAAALAAGRFFPLSLGAEGSCQIGGNVATNAGGTGVLRYGNTRDLVLGLEAVLPDGRVWNGLRSLRKNNTGYDLKQLFIGSEGTLGVITAVTLKLFPKPVEPTSILVSFADIGTLFDLADPLMHSLGSSIVAMELMSASEIRIVRHSFPDISFPLAAEDGWFILVDIGGDHSGDGVGEILEAALAGLMGDGRIRDVVVTMNERQRAAIWQVRHSVSESHKKYGMGMSHDIAVPLGRIAEFIQQAGDIVAARFPDTEIAVVGHVGDGNLHYNVIFEQSRWAAIEDKAKMRRRIFRTVYDIAVELGGTFSAEHGIGALHLGEMRDYKSPLELDLMRQVKALFDPAGIMNPGRVIPDASSITR